MSLGTYNVCVACAIRTPMSVRQLIGHAIRPFTPSVLCWCDEDQDPWWYRFAGESVRG